MFPCNMLNSELLAVNLFEWMDATTCVELTFVCCIATQVLPYVVYKFAVVHYHQTSCLLCCTFASQSMQWKCSAPVSTWHCGHHQQQWLPIYYVFVQQVSFQRLRMSAWSLQQFTQILHLLTQCLQPSTPAHRVLIHFKTVVHAASAKARLAQAINVPCMKHLIIINSFTNE